MASLAPSDRQGSAQGALQAVTGAGVLLAGLWAGLAWGGSGRLPLLVSGAAGLAVAAALLVSGGRVATGRAVELRQP